MASSVYILPAYQNDYAGGNSYDMFKYTYKDTDPVEWKPLDGKYYHNYSDDAAGDQGCPDRSTSHGMHGTRYQIYR